MVLDSGEKGWLGPLVKNSSRRISCTGVLCRNATTTNDPCKAPLRYLQFELFEVQIERSCANVEWPRLSAISSSVVHATTVSETKCELPSVQYVAEPSMKISFWEAAESNSLPKTGRQLSLRLRTLCSARNAAFELYLYDRECPQCARLLFVCVCKCEEYFS